MNIIDIQDNLKNFSEQQLVSEMQSPSGNAPQFLVLSEIQRRKRVRDDFAKREAANEPTVAQEAIAAAGVPQSGVMGMREAMNPKRTMVQNMRSGGLMALGSDIQRGFSGKVDPFLDEVKGMAESRFDIDLDSQQGQNARMPMVDPSRALNNPRTPRVGAGKGGTPTPTAGGSAFGSPLTQDFFSRSSYANNNDFIRGIGSLMNVIPMKEGGVIKAQSGAFFNDGMPTEELLRAIMMQESGGDPTRRGALDEVGAFQIRPSTALLPVGGKSMFPELSAQIGEGKKYKNADEAYLDNKEMIDSALEDIGKSRQFAGDYLGALRSRAGSDEGAIAAYNRGLGGLKNVKDPSQLDYFKGVSSFMTEQDAPSLIDRGKDLASSVVSGISDALSPKEAIAQGVSNPSLAMQGRPFGVTANQSETDVQDKFEPNLEDRANIEIATSGSEILTVEPSIIATEPVDIKWFQVCGLESRLYGPNGFIAEYLSQCDYTDTTTIRIEQHVLETFEIDMNSMEDGEYSLVFETNTAPQVKSTILFEWPLSQENSNVVNEEITETENIQSILVQGYWSATTGEYGKCWLLNTQDDQIITLSGSPGLLNWMPEIGVNGQYSAYESEPSPACDLFAAPSITITEVVSEDKPELEISPEPENVVDTLDVKSEDELDPMIISAGIVVASGGILSLLFALITTNETLRIPATTIGLWFLGLIGRTSETSDGRYQRGRLMGYLTANPGCHFRALMAALDMSNGQITHHLKILQDEDRIWRRPDGRLVRFYPYTTDLHPEISDDDLPLPPLSPDPNSLQGKILRLLDDDGQMNKSPTQAELAQRLERSQQLVSHHLRTLQKFGLVERLKKGMKNRYCLTREAVFLLDTTEL